MGFIIGFGEMIVIALVVFSVTFMYIVPVLRRRAMLEKPKRGAKTNDTGKVIRVEEREKARSFSRSGTGSYASNALKLFAGVYRLEYAFPEESPVALKLINLDNAEEITILIKSGSGSHAFTIDTAGRYLLNIDPTAPALAWEVSFRQM